jgi:exodeoxyribonuclease VII large subunit
MSKTDAPLPLVDAPRPGTNLPEFSVGELSTLLKQSIEERFSLVRVRGEISECKHHSSGHLYLTLKDDTTVLAAVCWRGQVNKLSLKPALGMEVICTGRITTYMGQSKYQMVVESMTLAGIGALLKMIEERKKRLAAEGLFNPANKQLLPFLPHVIGVITSPTGAVIRDILHRLADRFPRHVLVWPVAVQGENAAAQITAAIHGFNNLPTDGAIPRPDVLIVARGGGSVEDLMPFNDEDVVRAAAASYIPLISAVGHETDTTLIDFASDVRAPTPTAAAEMVVPVRADLQAQVMDDGRQLWNLMRRMLQDRREHLTLLSRALGDPLRAIEPLAQRLDDKAERLALAWQNYFVRHLHRVSEVVGKLHHPRDILALAVQRLTHADHRMQGGWRDVFLRKQNRSETLGTVLSHLSPKAVLGRGYTLIHDMSGHIIVSEKRLKKGDKVRIEFHDGARGAVVGDT